MLILYSMLEQSQLFMEDCLPIIEPWPLVIEDLVISDYPNTPGC
jgi:hypothetical protein